MQAAAGMHSDPCDLVHHTYLRILRLKGVSIANVMRSPLAYFKRAMYVEATRGQFKRVYTITESYANEPVAKYDMSRAFMLENFELACDLLPWFDRIILKLFCDGYNLSEVARESGIKPTTLHTSLHRTRTRLRNHFAHSNQFSK